MRHVLVIAPKALPYLDTRFSGVFGGAEVQLSLLAKEFVKEGLQVTILVGDYGQMNTLSIDGLVCRKAFGASNPRLIQFLSILVHIVRSPGSVLLQRALTPVSGFLAVVARAVGAKFVYMVAHDSEADGTHRLYKTPLGRLAARLCFTCSSLVVTQNQKETDQLIARYSRARIVLNKKGLPDSKSQEADVRPEYAAIWVGRSERWKRPDVFLRLAEELPKLRFAMVCSRATNDDGCFDSIEGRAAQLQNLDFIPGAPSPRVLGYMRLSKSYVFTSASEGDWPMVVLEAAAQGLPILAYQTQYEYLLTEYKGGVFLNGHFGALKEEVLRLNSDSLRRTNLGESARRYVLEHHGIRRSVLKLRHELGL